MVDHKQRQDIAPVGGDMPSVRLTHPSREALWNGRAGCADRLTWWASGVCASSR